MNRGNFLLKIENYINLHLNWLYPGAVRSPTRRRRRNDGKAQNTFPVIRFFGDGERGEYE